MISWRVNWLKMLCISEAQARDSDQTQTWNKLGAMDSIQLIKELNNIHLLVYQIFTKLAFCFCHYQHTSRYSIVCRSVLEK